MNGMNADGDGDEENKNSLKAKGFWYHSSPVHIFCGSEYPQNSSSFRKLDIIDIKIRYTHIELTLAAC